LLISHPASYRSPISLCFSSNPTQGFLPVGERLPLDHPAITDGVDIRKTYILPTVATVGANPGVNKYDDPVASNDKPLRFAVYLGPGGTGLRQILFHAISPMIRAAARELRRLGPLDLRIERFYGCGHIAPIEGCVCSRESSNDVFHVRRNTHFSRPP
jgi:hypothetical protein